MKRALASALAVGTVMLLAAPSATATPDSEPPEGDRSQLMAPIGQRLTASRQNEPSLLRLDIVRLDPRVVTESTRDLTVVGRVTNTGDRRIDDLSVRLQRGEALNTEVKLREALVKTPRTDSVNSGFVDIGTSVQPGEAAEFTVSVPLRGGQGAMQIDESGVYPLLVNVNGAPDFGKQARLAAMSMLLPVLSVPGGAPARRPPSPSRITMLWPLVDDQPRMLQPTNTGQAVLSDDGLADSLAPGGRLFSLLDVADNASTANSPALRSMCFTIDPSLLEALGAMSGEYLVRTPDGRTIPGKGATAARLWLDRLRSLTNGQCVLALPYADADLVALSRSGSVDLERVATGSAEIVRNVLRPVQPLQSVLWPLGGTLDVRTLADLTTDAPATVLADDTRLQRVVGNAPYSLGSNPADPATRTNRVMPIDQLVSSSLEGGQQTDAVTTPASVQNGLATLVFRTAFQNRSNQPILIAPPRRWTAPANELDVFLKTLSALYDTNYAEPLPLAGTLNAPIEGSVGAVDYTPEDAAREISGSVLARVSGVNSVQRDLLGAMQTDAATQVRPENLIAPLQYGLLRAASGAWRGREAASDTAVTDVQRGLQGLRGQVTVVRPALPFSLASSDSKLPVQISNGLPVAVTVRIAVGETAGLRPSQMASQLVSALSGITHFIPAEVIRSGRFTVDIGLTTPSGETLLGESSRFELSSTSYGTITLAITSTAAAALVLLFGRRMYRRFKAGSPAETGDGADERGRAQA